MKKRNILGLALVLLLLTMTHASVASATVWYVDNNALPGGTGFSWQTAFSSVQGGINAAVSGDEVWVKQGTYYENIIMKDGVGLYGGFAGTENLRSQRDWNQNITVVDGSSTTGVTIQSCPNPATRIDGLTIRNGTGVKIFVSHAIIENNRITGNAQNLGGGIYCSGSTVIISNNWIEGNTGYAAGGIFVEFATVTIDNNSILNNTSLDHGGGIRLQFSPSSVISRNLIEGNSAGGLNGGGIFGYSGYATDNLSITNNTIRNNSARLGGGVFFQYEIAGPIKISNNMISGNTAYGGGGIYVLNNALISNNVISANSATGASGGGLAIGGASLANVVNNTIAGNTAAVGGGGVWTTQDSSPTIANNIIAFGSTGIYNASRFAPVLTHNNVFDNPSSNYSGVAPGIGDISADPLFVDSSAGDYHLRVGSPCINAGDNSAVQSDWIDIDGAPRVTLSDGVGIVDIGADEYYVDTTPPTVTGTIPLDNAANIPLNQIITITFSEDIQVVPPESNIFLYDEKRFVLVDRTLSINGNVLTITPVLLRKNTTYSVNIPAFSIKDLAGNEMTVDKVFYFTTVK